MSRKIIVLIVGLTIATGGAVAWRLISTPEPKTNPTSQSQSAPKTTEQKTANTVEETAAPPQFSLDEPSSIWMVVNKHRPLPSTYTPDNLIAAGNGHVLRSDAADALKQLLSAANTNGFNLRTLSGYRSYTNQASVYNGYVKRDGQALADTYSARPGHSEHQTGLAVDLGNGTCDLEICFGTTAAGKWLAAHAHEYGFIIRYPNGKTSVTGYQYEPWHLRYVGTDLSKKVYGSGKTLEEYFGLPAAPNY